MEHGNKGFGEDLTEGKFSYPILHSVLSRPKDPQLIYILRQRTSDVNTKNYALRLIEETGSMAATANRLRELEATSRGLIRDLGSNPKLERLLDQLAEAYSDDSQ